MNNESSLLLAFNFKKRQTMRTCMCVCALYKMALLIQGVGKLTSTSQLPGGPSSLPLVYLMLNWNISHTQGFANKNIYIYATKIRCYIRCKHPRPLQPVLYSHYYHYVYCFVCTLISARNIRTSTWLVSSAFYPCFVPRFFPHQVRVLLISPLCLQAPD